jgi:hypothetical protein
MVPRFTTPSLIRRNELLDHDWGPLNNTGCLEPDVITCAIRLQDRTTQVPGDVPSPDEREH